MKVLAESEATALDLEGVRLDAALSVLFPGRWKSSTGELYMSSTAFQHSSKACFSTIARHLQPAVPRWQDSWSLILMTKIDRERGGSS
jgi:hypothetical protein